MAESNPLDRFTITARVMKSLARLRAHSNVLPVRDASGSAPIVVALPDEQVGDVSDRVKAMGGLVNLIYATLDGFTILRWDDDAISSSETIEVHAHSTMAMLVLYVEQHPDVVTSLNITPADVPVQELEYQF